MPTETKKSTRMARLSDGRVITAHPGVNLDGYVWSDSLGAGRYEAIRLNGSDKVQIFFAFAPTGNKATDAWRVVETLDVDVEATRGDVLEKLRAWADGEDV